MDQPNTVPDPQPDAAPAARPSTQSDPEIAALTDELRLLRKYLVVTLAATVVVTFCFNVYLYRVDRATRGQLAQAREAERASSLAVNSLLDQVVSFGHNHPGVAQMLLKYGIKPTSSNAPAATPTNAPAPGTAPRK